MRTAGSAELLEQRRTFAARMFERGDAAADIAPILGVHVQTVRLWRREYDAGGLKALAAKPHPGPACRLDDRQKQKLIEMLGSPPAGYGYDAILWTTALIARLIEDRFDVHYHHDHVGVILHQLGYSYQRPAMRAKERDEAKIEAWRRERWPEIVDDARQRNATLCFVDEAGFSMIPSVKKQWAKRGHTPVVSHRNRWHRKVSVVGAMTARPDDDRPQTLRAHFDWHPGGHVDQAKAVAFLDRLNTAVPGELTVVWDNLSAHKGPKVRDFLGRHPQVKLEFLPPYAPELNPIEVLWCNSKHHRLANHRIDDLETLHTAAQNATDHASQPHLLHAAIREAKLHHALWPRSAQ
ncbi:MAG: IS630 family transposase [Pseudomonadota bacterium]